MDKSIHPPVPISYSLGPGSQIFCEIPRLLLGHHYRNVPFPLEYPESGRSRGPDDRPEEWEGHAYPTSTTFS